MDALQSHANVFVSCLLFYSTRDVFRSPTGIATHVSFLCYILFISVQGNWIKKGVCIKGKGSVVPVLWTPRREGVLGSGGGAPRIL